VNLPVKPRSKSLNGSGNKKILKTMYDM